MKPRGLMPVAQDESESQPAQNLEAALKKRRERSAQNELQKNPTPMMANKLIDKYDWFD